MPRVTCAISGIRFSCSFLEETAIPHTAGYFHPVFALPYQTLQQLYIKHTKGELSSNDSYLLFIAFLHSSDKIDWQHPAALNPNSHKTKQLIENNLSQLLRVLEKTALIKHPSFKQPEFKVTYDNCHMSQITNWILAWKENIEDFQQGRIDSRLQEELQVVENRLSKLILSGESPERFTHVIANWAEAAADFPPVQAEQWKATIRACFNINKMFNTPLKELKEIKDFCECNITAGSIHFHTLSAVLKAGIARHHDYLGGSSLALGYTLLSSTSSSQETGKATGGNHKLIEKRRGELEEKNTKAVAKVISNAPEKLPVRSAYSTDLDFLRAKLAYRVATTAQKEAQKEAQRAEAEYKEQQLKKAIKIIEEIPAKEASGNALTSLFIEESNEL